MGVSKTYTRPRLTQTLSTALPFTLLVAEKPGTPAECADGQAGTTGNLDARIKVDVDESGGATLKEMFRIETTLNLSADAGATPSVTVTITPINPTDGTDYTALVQIITVSCPMTMDAFQVAGGRARQNS